MNGIEITQYYKMAHTAMFKSKEEAEEFFNSHIGFYNIGDQYLIINYGYNNYDVKIERRKPGFYGKSIAEKIKDYEIDYVEARLPSKMFEDFPELDYIRRHWFDGRELEL